ncbi:MAG: hypothetical protein IIB83_08060 [Bacteroidetes bacterium]|nr:hypothetical protein [Bacteroidota bacterium]
MKALRNVTIFTIIIFSFVFPQKKDLTLKQVTIKGYTLSPKGLSQLKWRPGTDNFTYVKKVDKKQALLQEGIKSNIKETILILDDINSSLDNAGYDKLEKFPLFIWQDENTIRFWQKTPESCSRLLKTRMQYSSEPIGRCRAPCSRPIFVRNSV